MSDRRSSSTLEALLFLSAEPVDADALADATGAELHEVVTALERLREHYEFERRGLVLRELARRLGAVDAIPTPRPRRGGCWPGRGRRRSRRRRPRRSRSSPICSRSRRPEIARIRGVNAESAASTLLERGLIEEAGRSQFGAVLYRTTELFLRLFGLDSLDELPDPAAFDPSPELEEELRERLLRAGEAARRRA